MKKKALIIVIVTLLINILADRITKILAVLFLKGKESVKVIHDLFILTYTENSGAFLSLGASWPSVIKYIVLLIVPIIVCVVIVIYSLIREKRKSRIILLCTFVAGGLSNMVDRLFNDFRVIDFMNFGIGNVRTGVLNVADLSITFAALSIAIIEIYEMNRKSSN